MNKRQTTKALALVLLILSTLFGQGTSYPPPTTLVTIPTAGTLVRGSFSMEMRVQKGGGMSTALQAGITDRFQFGLSYVSITIIVFFCIFTIAIFHKVTSGRIFTLKNYTTIAIS